MPHRKSKKQSIAVKVNKKKITPDDLLPESREFLLTQEDERIDIKNIITLKQTEAERQVIEKEEKNKKLVMWTGITFFMVAIIAVWGWNMNRVLKQANAEMAKNSQSQEFKELGDGFGKMLEAFKQSTTQLNDLKSAVSTSTASSTDSEFNMAGIKELKARLEASASTTATSTQTAGTTNQTGAKNKK